MKLIVMDSSAQIADAVSKLIIDLVRQKPNASLGFATGSSPVETYERLISACKQGDVSFKGITTFNLDEYCGLSGDNENSYRFFMGEKLFSHIDLLPENVNFLNGCAADETAECKAYSALIDKKGIDIQLLGVGRNGHIGFNEPSDEFSDGAHCVALAQSTIDANTRFFANRECVPTHALTMGIGDIMKAKKILLIATGEAKASAVKAMFEGRITPQCPASVLRMHPDASIFTDRAAASLLETTGAGTR